MDIYPDTLAFVNIHVWDDSYDLDWGNNRVNWYGIEGIPHIVYDGVQHAGGAGSLEPVFLSRQPTPTDVTMKLTGKQVGDRTYDVTAEVCIEAGGVAKGIRIQMIHVLDHWPIMKDYYRNCFMQAAETQDVDLLPGGACARITNTFTMDDDSWANQENIKILAWAQEQLDNDPVEDHQAAKMTWPFPTAMEWVTIGDPGNDADDTTYGSVSYEYRIGKYEVTNSQYIDFLNAVAATDTNALYSASMSTDPAGGIDRSGASGSYTYGPKGGDAGWTNRPVNFVNWYDALRFANWMHNGKPSGAQDATTTEDGAYDMSLGASVVRKPGATVFVPSEDEWYKAAYYKGGGTSAGYWDYPTQSDTAPTAEVPPGTDMANGSANYNSAVGATTAVGAYDAKPSGSASGTYDQGGNVWEWNEALIGSFRGHRGGWHGWDVIDLEAGHRTGGHAPELEFESVGFRLASFEDCDGNSIPDVCDFDCSAMGGDCNFAGCGGAADCNNNGVIDVCDTAARTTADCQLNGVPDVCDTDPTDPDGNTEVSADCDADGRPDECQVDCTLDGIPDVCAIRDCPAEDPSCQDCNVNAVPDGCDIAAGTSPDLNSSGIPDECEQRAPAIPPAPHNASKNRYLSIDPTTSGSSAVAIELTLTQMLRCGGDDRRACNVDGDCPNVCDNNNNLQCESDGICGGGTCIPTGPCVNQSSTGMVKWVGEPYTSACVPLADCGDQHFANVVDTPVYHVWTEDKVHVIGCEVVPAAVYEMRTTAFGTTFSDPLVIGTINKPQGVHYGDCVGPVSGEPPRYTAPDGFTNVVDIQAYLAANQGVSSVPSTTWVDLHSSSAPVVPQQILNVGDLQTIKAAFAGKTFVETPGQLNPEDCP